MTCVVDKRYGLIKVFKDKTAAARYIGVHPSTIARWLPYFENTHYIIGECLYEKSGKGTNNLPKM